MLPKSSTPARRPQGVLKVVLRFLASLVAKSHIEVFGSIKASGLAALLISVLFFVHAGVK